MNFVFIVTFASIAVAGSAALCMFAPPPYDAPSTRDR